MYRIPIYTLSIDTMKEEYGVSVMSFVKDPAVGKNFITLCEESTIMKLSVNEEKRVVTGVALRADYPIYRQTQQGKEFYFTISPDEMQNIVQKFMQEKRGDSVNIEHGSETHVNGVFLIESFLLSEHHKLAYPEFKDVENGSWMVSYKVNNPHVWDAVKNGSLKGFSVEITGDLHEQTRQELSRNRKLFELLILLD
ncbi:MAG: XkdF-like putative serine protease domain-containing protein, partial [Bacteroides sp.]|nr:XkdF-like putative serine protease domain-containing protein [Bacteroides sp.]